VPWAPLPSGIRTLKSWRETVRAGDLTLTRVFVDETIEGVKRVSWEDAGEVGEEHGNGEVLEDEVGVGCESYWLVADSRIGETYNVDYI
jgi:hypothetical protein